MSILNEKVSYFLNKEASTKGVEVNLLSLLQSNKHKEKILNLRQQPDEVIQKELKNKLPCFTVAGTFSRRCEEGIIQLSGLAAIDLDSAEGYDAIHLLNELKKINCIAYAGLSCRGNRLFCIVPFLHPDKYAKHYERLIQSFIDMGLPMGDDCHKKISQPRFVSWNDDTTQFFNHNAKPYSLLPIEKTYHKISRKINNEKKPENHFEIALRILEKQSNFFQDGNKHNYIFGLCCWLNKMSVPQSEAEEYINNHLLPLSEIKSNCIEFPYKNYSGEFGTFEFERDGNRHYSPQTNKPQSVNNFINAIEEPTEATQLIEQTKHFSKPETPTKTAYIDNLGKLYIPTPPSQQTFTVYPTVESYNKRTCLPDIEPTEIFFIDEMKTVFIDLKTLTIF